MVVVSTKGNQVQLKSLTNQQVFKFNIHDNYTENNLYSYKQNQD